jgi:hypothetical protein
VSPGADLTGLHREALISLLTAAGRVPETMPATEPLLT